MRRTAEGDAENVGPGSLIGGRNQHVPVQPTRPHQRRIQQIRTFVRRFINSHSFIGDFITRKVAL